MDGERLAAQQRRQIVGVQASRVHHRAGADPLSRSLQLDALRAGRAAGDGSARQQVRLALAGQSGQRPHQRLGLDDPGQWRPERGGCGDGRLTAPDEFTVDDFEIAGAVGAAARGQRLELRDLVRPAAGDQLAAARVRHAVPGAEPIERVAPLDAQAGLERAVRVVDAGVDHAAVVGARLHSGPRLPLQHAGGAPAAGGGAGDCQADDTPAHDCDIHMFHGACRRRQRRQPRSATTA